jgi:hypothetical protein
MAEAIGEDTRHDCHCLRHSGRDPADHPSLERFLHAEVIPRHDKHAELLDDLVRVHS